MNASVQANYTRIIIKMEFELFPREIGGARVTSTKAGWRLELAAGDRHGYRLAQVDDYAHLGKRQFKYSPLWRLRLRARVSRADIPGTWGFGLWNDPFGFSIGFGGKKKQLPALPQVAWFMHASEPNWLSFEDSPAQGTRNRLPGNGFFAGTLRSRRMPSMLFVLAAPLLPLLLFRPVSRLVKRLANRTFIQQDGTRVEADVAAWHEYSVDWLKNECTFAVDGKEILRTFVSPLSPLGLVIWIDNQYAAWTPEGRIGYGTLANEHAWMEVEGVSISIE
jgi:hypothetical protein